MSEGLPVTLSEDQKRLIHLDVVESLYVELRKYGIGGELWSAHFGDPGSPRTVQQWLAFDVRVKKVWCQSLDKVVGKIARRHGVQVDQVLAIEREAEQDGWRPSLM